MQWSLEDIYKKQVRGNIPPRKHLHVLGEAQVDITYDSGETDVIGDVDNKKASSIADYLRDKAVGSIMLQKDFKVIQALAAASGFSKMANFLMYVFMGFKDVDYEGLQKFVGEKDGLSALGSQLTGSDGSLDLWAICLPQIQRFIKNEDDWGWFYNMLFVKDFKEGNVSVGAGELALAVLTEAKKGTTGDLEIGNLQIEVKTGMGRVLSQRTQGFKDDWMRIKGIITSGGVVLNPENPEAKPTLDFDPQSFWNNKYAKSVLTPDNLEIVLKRKRDEKARVQYVGALLLHEYGRRAEGKGGFDILLAVFQHGLKAAPSKDRLEAEFQQRVDAGLENRDKLGRFAKKIPGTWWDANYVNVAKLEDIFKAVDSGLIQFQFNGEGVSIFYPKSSSTAAGDAGAKFQLGV